MSKYRVWMIVSLLVVVVLISISSIFIFKKQVNKPLFQDVKEISAVLNRDDVTMNLHYINGTDKVIPTFINELDYSKVKEVKNNNVFLKLQMDQNEVQFGNYDTTKDYFKYKGKIYIYDSSKTKDFLDTLMLRSSSIHEYKGFLTTLTKTSVESMYSFIPILTDSNLTIDRGGIYASSKKDFDVKENQVILFKVYTDEKTQMNYLLEATKEQDGIGNSFNKEVCFMRDANKAMNVSAKQVNDSILVTWDLPPCMDTITSGSVTIKSIDMETNTNYELTIPINKENEISIQNITNLKTNKVIPLLKDRYYNIEIHYEYDYEQFDFSESGIGVYFE